MGFSCFGIRALASANLEAGHLVTNLPTALRASRRAIFLAALLLLSVAFAACGDDDHSTPRATVPLTTTPTGAPSATVAVTAFPFTLTDSGGTAIVFTEAPKRVISYSPGATEILFAVGAGDQVVGIDKFADYPPEAQSRTKLEYSKPAPEPALALNPDLIIMATRQEAQVSQFRALGLRVVLLKEPTDLGGVVEQVRNIAHVTGHVEKGDSVANAMTGRIDAVKARLSSVTTGPTVFFEVTADGFTSGPDTFIASLLSAAKAVNVAGDAKTAFPQLSSEVIIAANPDVILLSDGGSSGGQSLDTVRARPGWQAIKAVRDGRVSVVDSALFTRPGPRVVDALEQLAQLLYPNLK